MCWAIQSDKMHWRLNLVTAQKLTEKHKFKSISVDLNIRHKDLQKILNKI